MQEKPTISDMTLKHLQMEAHQNLKEITGKLIAAVGIGSDSGLCIKWARSVSNPGPDERKEQDIKDLKQGESNFSRLLWPSLFGS